MSGDGHTGPIPENRGRPVCPRRLPLLVASADLGLQVGVGGVGPLTPPVGGESFLKQAANVRRQSRLMRGRRALVSPRERRVFPFWVSDVQGR